MGKTFVIAEAGVNHNGSMEMAKRLVDVAKASGVDAVKFQTFKAEEVVVSAAPKAAYQLSTTDASESQLQMIKGFELSFEQHREIADYCGHLGIEYMSTPFDMPSLHFLTTMGLKRLKLPSGEITNAPLLLAAAKSGLPVILSTGMATLDEVRAALGVLAFGYTGGGRPSLAAFKAAGTSAAGGDAVREKVSLLHCTTEYPAPFDAVNLRAMDTMRSAFGTKVGFSDHTPGITAAIAAVARGAVIVEKHFTLDQNLPGPDHKASLSPAALCDMVRAIREAEAMLGDGDKKPAACEIKNAAVVRKSLVARRAVRAGEFWSDENLTCKRPGTGLSPMMYWDLHGRPASKDYEIDEVIVSEPR